MWYNISMSLSHEQINTGGEASIDEIHTEELEELNARQYAEETAGEDTRPIQKILNGGFPDDMPDSIEINSEADLEALKEYASLYNIDIESHLKLFGGEEK